jgi:tryptophan 7-halogenase
MRKIAVIGVGSAGIQSLCHLLGWLGGEWQVTSIYSPKIPILGIGESTNPGFVHSLERGVGFCISDPRSLKALDATYKIGTEYTNWRPESFINPFLGGSLAIHMDTHSLQAYVVPLLNRRWGDRFSTIEGAVQSVEQNNESVSVEIEGTIENFEYVLDCRGFPDSLDTGYETYTPILDRCLVHNISIEGRQEREVYTTGHVASKNGWMFEVPLHSRTSYGYLYNSAITTEEGAMEDFASMLKTDVSGYSKYKFSSYISKNIINNRIIKCGNKAVFFDPMFANSLWMYNNINEAVIDHILGGVSAEAINSEFVQEAQDVLNIIALHYLDGSNMDTEFWRYAKEWSRKRLDKHPELEEHLEVLGAHTKGKAGYRHLEARKYPFDELALAIISRNLGYKYL